MAGASKEVLMIITWLHDYSADQYIGGAELTDMYWIIKGKQIGLDIHEVTKADKIVNKKGLFIVGNVWRFTPKELEMLRDNKYILIVHGEPRRDIEWLIPEALKVVYMSPAHMQRINLGKKKVYSAPFVSPKLFMDRMKHMKGKVYIGCLDASKGIKQTIDHYGPGIDFYGRGDLKVWLKNAGYNVGRALETCEVPAILNEYTTFSWYLPRKGSYGRTIVEAILCGLELEVNKENFEIFSYDWNFSKRENVAKNLYKQLDNFWNLILND